MPFWQLLWSTLDRPKVIQMCSLEETTGIGVLRIKALSLVGLTIGLPSRQKYQYLKKCQDQKVDFATENNCLSIYYQGSHIRKMQHTLFRAFDVVV